MNDLVTYMRAQLEAARSSEALAYARWTSAAALVDNLAATVCVLLDATRDERDSAEQAAGEEVLHAA